MTGESIEHTADGPADVRQAARCSRSERREPRRRIRGRLASPSHAGEILGLIGLLGAGRTELALALFGMTRLDGGEIAVDGSAGSRSPRTAAAIAAGIAYVSEDRLCSASTCASRSPTISRSPSSTACATASAWSRSSGGTRWRATGSTALNIRAGGRRRPVQTLSGGNQQRVVLAKWLATRPKVLILDSPTIGVDIRNKAGIHEVVRALADERHGDPADLGRGLGGLLQLATACCTCARAGSPASTFPASASERAAGGGALWVGSRRSASSAPRLRLRRRSSSPA